MMDLESLQPTFTRVRHETRRRSLTVLATHRLSPNMLRLRFGGPDLAGFTSLSPGDHVKLFVPEGSGGIAMRDYTPRRYSADGGWLDIDFALHDAGPATRWAKQARPGDRVEIGGPRGSLVIGGPVAGWLLIGDETALPSIARRIEEMAPGVPVTSIIAIADASDRQQIETLADHRAIWVHREDAVDPSALLDAVAAEPLASQMFVWIAAEANVARALRDAVVARGVPSDWMRAAGYWVAGAADASVKDL
jgi:NADPH-dependent ferric siderophore reductase